MDGEANAGNRTMTPAGLETAIPGSVSRCVIHEATRPLVRSMSCMIQQSPTEQDAWTCARSRVCVFACGCPLASVCVRVCVCVRVGCASFAGVCTRFRPASSMRCVLLYRMHLALRLALLHCECAWSALCGCRSQWVAIWEFCV